MRTATLRQALWHRHVGAVGAPPAMQAWLSSGGSLTARLMAHSASFRVQRLHQRTALCLADESRAIGMPREKRGRVWEREVLLRCDEVPVVFAHTVMPMSATVHDWPRFNGLGERSLGSTLFYDPLVTRGELEYARIRAGHPLMRRACAALGVGQDTNLYARRCLYRRHQGTLLVTEVFLPTVMALQARPPHNTK